VAWASPMVVPAQAEVWPQPLYVARRRSSLFLTVQGRKRGEREGVRSEDDMRGPCGPTIFKIVLCVANM
jgi:hypothetical protein